MIGHRLEHGFEMLVRAEGIEGLVATMQADWPLRSLRLADTLWGDVSFTDPVAESAMDACRYYSISSGMQTGDPRLYHV